MFLFAEDSLDGGPDGGPNFAEILNKALPDSDHSSDSQSDRSSNSGEVSLPRENALKAECLSQSLVYSFLCSLMF